MVFQLKTFCGCQNVEDGSRTVSILQMVMGAVYAGLSIYNEMIQGKESLDSCKFVPPQKKVSSEQESSAVLWSSSSVSFSI